MDVELINPFLTSTVNVLKTMAFTEARPSSPLIKKTAGTFGDITGVIGMASATLSGSMILSFSQTCILQVLAKMLNESPKTSIDDEVVDAVGELTNMICGGAKAELAKLDHRFDIATPTMIVGKSTEVTYHFGTPTIIVPFETEHGGFVIEANLTLRR